MKKKLGRTLVFNLLFVLIWALISTLSPHSRYPQTFSVTDIDLHFLSGETEAEIKQTHGQNGRERGLL